MKIYIIAIIFLLTSGCAAVGLFSGVGETEVTTKKGTTIIETTDLESCTKTVITEFKNGTKIKRKFPMDPEICELNPKESPNE